jgi:Flp pilus assembly protein protease CpaA
MDNFLFWFFLAGVIIATLQDIKRREVDNWLNLFLLLGSLSYIFFKAVFENDISIIALTGFVMITMFIMMNLFYYGRIFGGGDAVLLFSMTAFFVGATFIESSKNIIFFIILLMVSGSAYGLVFSITIYFKNFKKTNKEIIKQFNIIKKNGILYAPIFLGIVMIFLSYFSFVFIIFSFIILTFPLLYIFARGVEKCSMIKEIPGKELREGDWLVSTQKIGNRIIKPNWEGLSDKEIKFLQHKKKIKIKDGMPFVPAFLIAIIIYALTRGLIETIL